MGNYKYYNYMATGNTLEISGTPLYPYNTHLIWEHSTYGIYFVRHDDQTKLVKNTDEGGTDCTNIDLTGATSKKIQSGWLDGDTLWLVCCDNTDDEFTVIYIELDNSDNVVDVGDSSGADANTVEAYDIFKLGSSIYVHNLEERTGDQFTVVWNVDSAPFVEEDAYNVTGDGLTQNRCSYGIIYGSFYYCIHDQWDGANYMCALYRFSVGSAGYLWGIDDYRLNTDRGLGGLAKDNDNTYVYYLANYTGDSLNYLIKHHLSSNDQTALGQYDVAIMLDRNVHGSNYPNTLEKGFHLTEDKIYQIPDRYTGTLNWISNYDFDGVIKAITDTYVITVNGTLYEISDYIDQGWFSYLFLDYWKEDYPELHMEYRRDKLTVSKGMFIQIIGNLSADDQDRLFRGTYNFDGEEDLEGTNIGFVDSASLYDGECIIVNNWQLHREVLRLQDDVTLGEDPIVGHNETQATSGIREFWIGTNDVTEIWDIGLYETGNNWIVKLRITGSILYYQNSGGGYTTILDPVANDTLYRIKIEWYADNTFDVYVNGTLEIEGATTRANQVSGPDKFYIQGKGDSADYFYFDAYGDSDNDSDYQEDDNQYIEEGGENQVIFDGIVDEYTGRKIQMAKVYNQADEMDEIEPSGTYTKDTDGLIEAILDDWHNYIHMGTLQDGDDLGTVILKGNKKSRKYFDQVKDFDGYTWAIRPLGAMDYDDGSVESDVALLYETGGHNDPIWDVDTVPISSGTNKVVVVGKINPTTGEPYTGTWNDTGDQQLSGIHPIVIFDATLDSNAKCSTKASAIGNRESGGYITVQCMFHKAGLGVIYPHQTMSFKYISEDVSLSLATYIVDGVGVDLLTDDNYLQISTGLIFEYEGVIKELPQENSQRIEQNATAITTKATVYVSASDPTVNEDEDSGYLNGDIWINSGDAGVYICIDNSSGAADWDELAKV